jgi:hypothetical protein
MTHVLQVLFLSIFILQVVMHGEESQVPGDLRQSEILIEQDTKGEFRYRKSKDRQCNGKKKSE